MTVDMCSGEDAGYRSSCDMQQSQRLSLQLLLTLVPLTLKTVTVGGTRADFHHAIFRSRAIHLCGGVQVTPRNPRSGTRGFDIVSVLTKIKIKICSYKTSLLFILFLFWGRGRWERGGSIITSEGLGVAAAARGLKWVSLWHMTFLSGWRWDGNVLQRLTSKSMLLTTACSVFWANLLCLASCMNYFTLLYLDDSVTACFFPLLLLFNDTETWPMERRANIH